MSTVTATNSVTSGTTSPTSASSTATSSTVDYNTFLTLMIEELKNQDPTNPTDSTQYMSQLASFSQVEQQTKSNTKLDSILTMSSLTQAESVIGKKVTSADGSTSGIVSSVAIGTDGVATATLAGGSTLTLNNGITIGAATGTGAS